jgi:dihydrofolate reductase
MAKLFFGLNQSLDGYVDHLEFATGPAVFRHFYEQVRDLTGSVYGRCMYEVMRIWDEDRPEWAPEQRDFAAAWRRQPKWAASRSSVGPNATLVEGDIEAVIRRLKAQFVGEPATSCLGASPTPTGSACGEHDISASEKPAHKRASDQVELRPKFSPLYPE